MRRSHRFLDRLLGEADNALRVMAAPARASRPSPAADLPRPELDADARRRAGGLMRVNHAGEVAAQALYRGQAAVARSPALRTALLAAAAEEQDHLAWCEERVRELGTHPSRLTPLWYAGSFAIGTLAGLAGDRLSLGFLAETEQQVTAHLDGHLGRLPDEDAPSRRIVAQMRSDEDAHRADALARGGGPLPQPVSALMRATARFMTTIAYRV